VHVDFRKGDIGLWRSVILQEVKMKIPFHGLPTAPILERVLSFVVSTGFFLCFASALAQGESPMTPFG
jgi:hypothetical protein